MIRRIDMTKEMLSKMKTNIEKTLLIFIMVLAVILGTFWINLNGQQFLNPKSRLGEWERRDFKDNPDYIMEIIGVKPGMIIGEAGAGGGYFTFHLSRKVGKKGFIFANDIAIIDGYYPDHGGLTKELVTSLAEKAGYKFQFHNDCDPPGENNTHQVHVFSWPEEL